MFGFKKSCCPVAVLKNAAFPFKYNATSEPDVMLRPCLDLVQMDGKCNSIGPLSSVNMSTLSQSSRVDI